MHIKSNDLIRLERMNEDMFPHSGKYLNYGLFNLCLARACLEKVYDSDVTISFHF